MSLPLHLQSSEVKNSAGTEVEFLHRELVGRKKVYAVKDEVPSRPHRITVQHEDIGAGLKLQRRSNFNTIKNVVSEVDEVTVVPIRISTTIQVPSGHLLTATETKNVIAEHMSFLASIGASTTILYDCTGYGAEVLANGST